MSDHHDHHADHHGHDHHGHDDHGHHGGDRPYFDDSTAVLAPVYIIIALVVIFGTLFFG
jgi:NADH-quinone oxidoreductase subunit L